MKAWGIYVKDELELSFGVWDTRRRALKALDAHYGSHDKIPKDAKIRGVEIIGNHVNEPAGTRANLAAHNAMRIIGFDTYADVAVSMSSDLFPYFNKIRGCIMECIEEKEASPEEIARREKEIEDRLSEGLVGKWIEDRYRDVCCQISRLEYRAQCDKVLFYNEDNNAALKYDLEEVEQLIKHHCFREVITDCDGGIVEIINCLDEKPKNIPSYYRKRYIDVIEEEEYDRIANAIKGKHLFVDGVDVGKMGRLANHMDYTDGDFVISYGINRDGVEYKCGEVDNMDKLINGETIECDGKKLMLKDNDTQTD